MFHVPCARLGEHTIGMGRATATNEGQSKLPGWVNQNLWPAANLISPGEFAYSKYLPGNRSAFTFFGTVSAFDLSKQFLCVCKLRNTQTQRHTYGQVCFIFVLQSGVF